MKLKPEDITIHIEGMPEKEGKEGLTKLIADGRVETYSWSSAFNKARWNLKNHAAKLGIKDLYYFKQIRELPSDQSYDVTVEGWYDRNSRETG